MSDLPRCCNYVGRVVIKIYTFPFFFQYSCQTGGQFSQNLFIITKESLLDRPKFCQSGSVVRHLFWRLFWPYGPINELYIFWSMGWGVLHVLLFHERCLVWITWLSMSTVWEKVLDANHWNYCVRSSAVITLCNMTLFCYWHNNDWDKICIRGYIHNRHPISRPHERAMGYLLLGFEWKLTAL